LSIRHLKCAKNMNGLMWVARQRWLMRLSYESFAKVRFCKQNTEVRDSKIFTLDNLIVVNDLHLFWILSPESWIPAKREFCNWFLLMHLLE
jgi:hypothetical protein